MYLHDIAMKTTISFTTFFESKPSQKPRHMTVKVRQRSVNCYTVKGYADKTSHFTELSIRDFGASGNRTRCSDRWGAVLRSVCRANKLSIRQMGSDNES